MDGTHSGASKNALYPLIVNDSSKSNAYSEIVFTAKPNKKTGGSPNGADRNSAKWMANQKGGTNKADDTGVSESLSSEEKSDNKRPTINRAKVKIDPPGYTNGPSVRFWRGSPKLTACAKSRG